MENKNPKKDYDPLNDFIFKKIMTEEGREDSLLSFLNALSNYTGINSESIKIISDKTITAESINQKSSIMDLRAENNDGCRFIVEVQRRNANEFKDRSLDYLCNERAISSIKGKNPNRKKYLPHVLINILDFEFHKGGNYIQKFNMIEVTEGINNYNEDFIIINIDLVKFRKLKNKDLNDLKHQWCYYFNKNKYPNEYKKVLNMNNGVKSADDKAKELFDDDENRRLYYLQELKEHEIETEIKDAKIEGEETGFKKGEKTEKIKIATELKKEKMPLEKIAKITALPLNTIKKL